MQTNEQFLATEASFILEALKSRGRLFRLKTDPERDDVFYLLGEDEKMMSIELKILNTATKNVFLNNPSYLELVK
jgi:hypothetical protein